MAITRSRGGWLVCERIPPTREGKRIRKWVPDLLAAARLVEGSETPAVIADRGPILSTFAPEFLRRHPPARKSPDSYRSNVGLLVARLGDLHLADINPAKIEDFRIARRDEDLVSLQTINRQVAALSAVFQAAKEWRVWTGPNPCREVKDYPEGDPRDRVFSGDEVARILAACADDPPVHALIVAALFLGLRKGELLALRWSDIRDGIVAIRGETAKGGHGRIIPMHPELAAELGALPRNGGMVFHRDGIPLTRDQLRTAWDRICRVAHIEDGRVHDLRRTFGSAAMHRGLGTGMIQRLLGHGAAHVTERYLHADREAMAATVPFLGPPKPSQARGQSGSEGNDRTSGNGQGTGGSVADKPGSRGSGDQG